MKNLLIPSLLTVIIFLGLFISCGTESTPVYTLTTSVNGEGSITPSGGEYEEGETVTLTSTPSQHWLFSNWSGDGSGSSSTLTITMDRDKSVVGNFVEREYSINYTINGSGTVEESIIQSKSEYKVGTLVQLTPVPDTGWKFVEWGGDVSFTEEVIEVTIDGETNITVTFERIDYLLTITIEGEGIVYERVVRARTTEYMHGTLIELGANPKPGWEFSGWSGSIQNNDPFILIKIDGDTNITATFKETETYEFSGVRFSRTESGGYYRLMQHGLRLFPNETYRLQAYFYVNNYRFQSTDNFELVGNGKWYQPIESDIEYFADGLAKFEGFFMVDQESDYTVQVAMWGTDSMISTSMSIVKLNQNEELLKNGNFLNGTNEWNTDGNPLEFVTRPPPIISSIDGFHLKYTHFDGESEELLAVEGEEVMLFIPFTTNYSRIHLKSFVSRLDQSWNYFREITGRNPSPNARLLKVDGYTTNYSEKPTLAVVQSTCGAGCGSVGSTGIELHIDHWPVTLSRHLAGEETRGIFEYEMGRNFWMFGSKLHSSDEPDYHLATAFATIFGFKAGVAGGSTTEPGNELVDWVQTYRDKFNDYLENPDFSKLTEGGQVAEKIHGGLWLYLGDEFGEEFFKGFFNQLNQRPNANNLQDAVTNFVISSCYGAQSDLSMWFKESLNYPVHSSACSDF